MDQNKEIKTDIDYSDEWYAKWFNKLYPKLYPHRNLEEAKIQVEALSKKIKLINYHSCLDIACGTGRHVRYLSKLFTKTIGLDLSADLIEIGINNGNFQNSSTIVADMRKPKLKSKDFDLVCNFFTGFGYFQTKEEHQELIDTWLDLVKDNGILFIDYLNKDYVIQNLVPESTRQIENYNITEKRQINGNRVEKEIIIESSNSEAKVFNESVRMFEKDEMEEFLSKTSKLKFYGDYQWNKFTKSSSRMLIIAHPNRS